ncbi:MAG: NUDIX hydrolase [Solirubrobacteraceae bacterium]
MAIPTEPEGAPVTPRWLGWTRRLQSVAQAGLTHARDPYDADRYREVRRVAAEIAATGSDGDVGVILGFFASERGYPTPKVDVRAAVIAQERILLVQERDDGGWALPGGWADVGESAGEAAVRETREEAGIEVRPEKLIALYERERRGHPPHPEFSYKIFLACGVRGVPEPRGGAETLDAAFFVPEELPPLSAARVTRQEIAVAFAHHRDPGLPTEFD